MSSPKMKVSIVTPTLARPNEIEELLNNLADQKLLPIEVIIVDGAPNEDTRTARVVEGFITQTPFAVEYCRKTGGTAIQRNYGIDRANGNLIAFIDDDVRLEKDFLSNISGAFLRDKDSEIGGITGYRSNLFFDRNESERWRWYGRLKLLSTYEPGKYDFETGYPINNNMQAPFEGTRPVDFMTTACTVWRKKVFESGLRFDHFFVDYGVLEDAHLSLRAGRNWKLLQCGSARCVELKSPHGRVSHRKIGFKSVVNYYYVFKDIEGPLSKSQKLRFWRYQAFELFRISASAVRRLNWGNLEDVIGRLQGIAAVIGGITDIREKSESGS